MKKAILLSSLVILFSTIVFSVSANRRNEFFSDVSVQDWFYPYVKLVNNWGLMQGDSFGMFLPKQRVNRAELAKVIALYDERVDDKISGSRIGRSSNSVPATVMTMIASDKEPNECPIGWIEADYGLMHIQPTRKGFMRTCYTNNACSTMNLERYNEEPNECPQGWTEADYGERWERGGHKQFLRTCYVCS